MLTNQKKGTAIIGLLPAATQPPALHLCPNETRTSPVPPIVGGFQMPLPGFSGCSRDEIEREKSLDWHCYLGSR